MSPGALLGWIGRQGSAVIAVGVFAGLALPPLAALLRPLLIPAIILPFLIALLRIDWRVLMLHVRGSGRLALALAWLLIALPIAVHVVASLLGLPPTLHAVMVLAGAAPPLMASASLALMLGLDAALAVVLTLAATALMPLTLPPLALHLLGVEIDIALAELMGRLGLIVGGCFLAAGLLRALLPAGFATRHAAPLDGLAVLGLVTFAIAIMDGLTLTLIAEPGLVLGFALAAFALNVGMQAIGAIAFHRRGRRGALTIGLCSGNANLGLLLVALADRASAEFVVFIAVAQFPIYTLPLLQRRLYRRWLAGEAGGRAPAELS